FSNEQRELASARIGESEIYFQGKHYNANHYNRDLLTPGHRIQGPAIVLEMDSTTVIFPRHEAIVDKVGNLLIQPDNSAKE
ncbi:MAG: hydantoinase/oxoprolinase family protein, partial [Aliidiomarina sp.]